MGNSYFASGVVLDLLFLRSEEGLEVAPRFQNFIFLVPLVACQIEKPRVFDRQEGVSNCSLVRDGLTACLGIKYTILYFVE